MEATLIASPSSFLSIGSKIKHGGLIRMHQIAIRMAQNWKQNFNSDVSTNQSLRKITGKNEGLPLEGISFFLNACGVLELVENTTLVLISQRCTNVADLRCKLSPGSNKRLHFKTSAIKLQDAGQFGEPKNLTNYVSELVTEKLCEPLLKPLKGFPWKDAKDRVLERLLILGENALKWSFLPILAVSFPSDLILAISRNRELLIPVGLFIGVALADLLKESLQVYFQNTVHDRDFLRLLLGIGSFFVLLKFISLSFKLQGRVLLSHVGNGGLMQVLWLVKKLQENGDKRISKEIVDSPSTST